MIKGKSWPSCAAEKWNSPSTFTTEQKRNAMKKIVFAGLLAISAMAIPQQQASAWVNSKFSVGLNWDMQSGGNNLLWGAWRNGQPPGPEAFGGGGGYGGGFGGGGYGGGGFGGPAYGMPTHNPIPLPHRASGRCRRRTGKAGPRRPRSTPPPSSPMPASTPPRSSSPPINARPTAVDPSLPIAPLYGIWAEPPGSALFRLDSCRRTGSTFAYR